MSKGKMMPGDWICPKCQDAVLSRSSNCRQCGESKIAEVSAVSQSSVGSIESGKSKVDLQNRNHKRRDGRSDKTPSHQSAAIAPEIVSITAEVEIPREPQSYIADIDHCIVCLEAIQCYAVGSCNHRNQCSRCYMISLKQYNRQVCVTCKAMNEAFEPVVLTSSRTKPHSQFNIRALNSSKHYHRTFFEDKKEMQKFSELFQAKCPLCGQTFRDLKELKGHARNEHNKQFCNVCIEKRKGVFPYQQRLYDHRELQVYTQDLCACF